MARLKENIEFAAARLVSGLADLLPMKAADWLAVGLGHLAHATLTSRRRIARDNLRHAFGDQYTDAQYDEITRQVFVNFARTTIEFTRFGVLSPEKIVQMTTGETKVWKRVLEEGKGGVIVSAHMGSWEMIPAWIAHLGLEICILAGRQHNQKIQKRLIELRRRMGVEVLEIPNEIRKVFKVIKGGGFIALISDQHATSGAVILDFFGRPAATPQGPATFAFRTGCPIIPVISIRHQYDRFEIITGEPIYPPSSGNEETDIRYLTEAYTAWFEEQIRLCPEQWLWTHRRWKAAN